MRRRITWTRALSDESGNITAIATVIVVVLATTLLPLVWNVGTISAARRGSQNGSDAAALAAAQAVADQLNAASVDWWGCIPPQTPPQIVQMYNAAIVYTIGNAQGGAGDAARYASANRGTLIGYTQAVAPMAADGVHAKLVDGTTVPPVRIWVSNQRNVVGSLIDPMYGTDGTPIKSQARAEVYLHRVRTWVTPCPAAPTKAIAKHYNFRWRVRLINTN